jgi:hypothetical protein
VNRFTDHLYTRLGTTSNYSATANLHGSQIATACCVFNSRSLATASNIGDSSASRAQIPSSQPPLQNSTELIAPTLQAITSRHGPHRKRSSIVAFVSVGAGTCLPSRYPETGCIMPFIKNPPPPQRGSFRDCYPATGLQAII